ncbi:MAG: hypothetical protein QOE54_3166 [Streptosporangiaceae bacterium]|jgi:hypothetical protein|nr:hypothetical protein [Streptosporangiaceae bacterium]
MTRIYSLPGTWDAASTPAPATSMGTVDPDATEAFVRVRLAAQTVPQVFEAWLLCRSAVCGVWSLGGDFDYEVRLVCTSPHDLAAEVRAIRRFGGAQTDTCLLLREVAAEQSIYHGED